MCLLVILVFHSDLVHPSGCYLCFTLTMMCFSVSGCVCVSLNHVCQFDLVTHYDYVSYIHHFDSCVL